MQAKKYLFLWIALFIAAPVCAQTEVLDPSDTTFWDFGVYVSPEYNYRMAGGSLNSQEEYRIGYTAGANFTRQLNKVLYIQSGIYYQSKGYKTAALQDTVLDLYDQFLYSSEFYNVYKYNTLSIPVVLRIKLFNAGKTQFNLGIGVAPDIFINKTTLQIFKDHRERDITKAEQLIDIKGIFNLNINIPMSDHWFFAIEPNFGYDILGMKDPVNSGVRRNMFTAGLGLQFSYRITDLAMYDYYYLNIYKKPPKSSF